MPERLTVKELQAEIARLSKLAFTDELTGLYNRHGFNELAGIYMREAAAPKRDERKSVIIKDLSVALFDLDHFKQVNDTYGHDGGDKVLAAFAKIIKARVREIDVPARWGGEELVLALIGASETDAARLADELRKDLIAAKIMIGRQRIMVTTSCGVASIGSAKTLNELIANADRALYAAKHGGRNKVIRASEL
jgi:diguanylate cyclase (GGDEF)-like protein